MQASIANYTFNYSSKYTPAYTPQDVINTLMAGNSHFAAGKKHMGNISAHRRIKTAQSGQTPYALILTCSDSRIVPEHIFNTGLGDLFVVRTAGNVVGEYELGSIEYGVGHLGIPAILVMGHKECGAVSAALNSMPKGSLGAVVRKIQEAIGGETNNNAAENKNIIYAKNRILSSPVVKQRVDAGKLVIEQAKYNMHSGRVEIIS